MRSMLELQAIANLEASHRLMKQAKAAPMPERAHLSQQALAAARIAYQTIDRFYAESMKGVA